MHSLMSIPILNSTWIYNIVEVVEAIPILAYSSIACLLS